jgi:deubiquitinase DESI2
MVTIKMKWNIYFSFILLPVAWSLRNTWQCPRGGCQSQQLLSMPYAEREAMLNPLRNTSFWDNSTRAHHMNLVEGYFTFQHLRLSVREKRKTAIPIVPLPRSFDRSKFYSETVALIFYILCFVYIYLKAEMEGSQKSSCSCSSSFCKFIHRLRYGRPSPNICILQEIPIKLNIYSLTNKNMYLSPIGLGVYHSAVQIGSTEVSFASDVGIFTIAPHTVPAELIEVIEYGMYKGTEESLKNIIAELSIDFHKNAYHLVNKNCNAFADALLLRLLSQGIPDYVNRLAWIGSGLLNFLGATCCPNLVEKECLRAAPVSVSYNSNGKRKVSNSSLNLIINPEVCYCNAIKVGGILLFGILFYVLSRVGNGSIMAENYDSSLSNTGTSFNGMVY